MQAIYKYNSYNVGCLAAYTYHMAGGDPSAKIYLLNHIVTSLKSWANNTYRAIFIHNLSSSIQELVVLLNIPLITYTYIKGIMIGNHQHKINQTSLYVR